MMDVIVVPVLGDNYSYLLADLETGECAAIDAVEPSKVLGAASSANLRVTHVLTTHSHLDHSGGNDEMSARLGKEVPIVAGKNDGLKCTIAVSHGDEIRIGKHVSVKVLDTPCHTPGHVCYVARVADRKVVFTGDTLFVGGSGNLNSGTPLQMYHALSKVLGTLDSDTEVFCGHNYTEKNLRWALEVEPENQAAHAKLAQARELNAAGKFIPSTIGGEKEYNPFMRADLEHIQQWANHPGDPVATLLKIRKGKDEWGRRN